MSNTGFFDRIDMESAAISSNVKSKAFNLLTVLFTDLASADKAKRITLLEEYSKIVFDEFGIKTELEIINNPAINAAAYFLDISKNNPILQWESAYVSGKEGVRVAKACSNLEGCVDFKNHKVKGILSEIRTKQILFSGTMEKLSAECTAAIMLHEIGHLWEQIAYLGMNTVAITGMMTVAQDIAKAQLNKDPEETTIRIIDAYSKHADIKLKGNVIGNISPEEAAVYIRDAYDAKWRSLHGYSSMDGRECEYQADQFAVRMGAGYHLGIGIDKMSKEWGESKTGAFSNLLAFLVLILTAVFFTVGLIIFYLLVAVLPNGYNPTYDPTAMRLERIWRNMLQNIKTAKNLLDEDKRRLIMEIEDLRKRSAQYDEDFTMFTKFLMYATFNGKAVRYVEEQHEQERIAKNTLFLAAEKLKLA